MRVVLSAVIVVGAASAASADEAWKAHLQAPLSPGAVAALVEHGEAPEVQARWRAALKHAAADVRAAAARAIYAAAAEALRGDLAARLAEEKDEAVAEELVRALGSLGTSDTDAALVDAARRFARLRPMVGNLLGRREGPEAIRHLAALGAFDDTRVARRCLIQAATRGGRDVLDPMAKRILDEGDAASWEAVWAVVLQGGRMNDDYIAAGMTSSHPRIRAITYWHAAMFLREDLSLSDAFKRGMKSAPEAERAAAAPGGGDEADAAFAFELMSRARGEKAHENVDWVRGLPAEPDKLQLPGPLWRVARHLTKDEREVLVEKKLLRGVEDDGGERPFRAASVPPATLDASMFPARYLDDLLHHMGCERRAGLEATLDYTKEGRPQAVTLIGGSSLAPACAEAARILFRSAYYLPWTQAADTGRHTPEPRSGNVQLTLGRGTAAGGIVGGVVGQLPQGAAPDRSVRVGGNIKEPKKLKHVNPVYPAIARSERITGLVILEAVIDPSGRVQDVKVLRSVNETLDEAAAAAVRKWVYTPTLLNGVPVPVIMTVTVNFELQ